MIAQCINNLPFFIGNCLTRSQGCLAITRSERRDAIRSFHSFISLNALIHLCCKSEPQRCKLLTRPHLRLFHRMLRRTERRWRGEPGQVSLHPRCAALSINLDGVGDFQVSTVGMINRIKVAKRPRGRLLRKDDGTFKY